MPKPAKKETAAKLNTVEALRAKAKELARQAEDAEERARETEHRERKRQTPGQVQAEKEREEFYQKHKKAIDKELKECLGYLKKYKDPEVPKEIIRRLRDYYLNWLGQR